MCFHWKSLLRQIRIVGELNNVSDKDADDYYNSRSYGSRIGAWASKQSTILKDRDELYQSINNFKKNFQMKKKFQDLQIGQDGIYHQKRLSFGLMGIIEFIKG